jgi:hypothetical protein
MDYALFSVSAVIGVEYILHIPLLSKIESLSTNARKSIAVIGSSKISDHWKEVVLLRYARDMLAYALLVAFMLTGLIFLVLLPMIAADLLLQPTPSMLEVLSSLEGIAVVTIVSVVYAILRRQLL